MDVGEAFGHVGLELVLDFSQFQGVLEGKDGGSGLLFQVVLRFSLFLKPVEVPRVQHVESVVLSHQDLRQLLKVELSPCHGKDGAWVRILEDLVHRRNTFLVDKALLEYDGVCDALHAVFYEELERVAVRGHVEVAGADFCDDEFDLEPSSELFGLA